MPASRATSAKKVLAVRDLMRTNVMTIRMDESVRTAKTMFDEKFFHHLVVMEKVTVVGVISDRDILKELSPFIGGTQEQPRDLTTLDKRIHQIMTRDLVTIGPDESAQEAARTMMRSRVSCLPVVDENMGLLGLITIRDFVSFVARFKRSDD